MAENRIESSQRSMRWYEWLAGLLLLGLACGVRAGSVYKCVDASGATAFQDRPCAAALRQSEVEIAPAPASAPAPHYTVVEHAERDYPRGPVHRTARPRARDAGGYECRASDGRVFYRLGSCPRSLAAGSGSNGRGRSRGSSSVSVSGHPIDRADACAQMRRAGAIGRDGHEFDEHISTYDKNLGRDPCA
ncbi:MAG: DUF4124 domain-containing protein [Rudaea sp.]